VKKRSKSKMANCQKWKREQKTRWRTLQMEKESKKQDGKLYKLEESEYKIDRLFH